MKILVADDDDIGRSLVEHMLEQAGFEVYAAADGREAIEIQAREGIRLVISDWEMPELTGIELCSKIREDECEGYTYVILLTSHAKPAEIVAGMTAGADDFIAKPFNAAELLVRVRGAAYLVDGNPRDDHLCFGEIGGISRQRNRAALRACTAILADPDAGTGEEF